MMCLIFLHCELSVDPLLHCYLTYALLKNLFKLPNLELGQHFRTESTDFGL